jgi:Protein of unknown function (DUF3047)
LIAVVALVAVVLSSLVGTAVAQARLAPLATVGDMPSPPWRVVGVPRQKSPLTRFALVDVDGRRALRIDADASYGNLVHPLEPPQTASTLSWEWRADRTVAAGDLRSKAGDDNALKVCVFFDLPLAQVPFVERQLLRLARSQSPEKLPAATVCYVWDGTLAAGTALDNAYTRRLRYLVLQSGPAAPGAWRRERRDLTADFLQLFGNESTQVPPIVGVAVGADADNTGGRALGHVTDLVLQ